MTKHVALITGAASGLGKATAELLSKDHTLILCDISERTLEEFCLYLSQKGTEVYPVICDVSKETDVTTAVDTAVKIGKIRSVFHSAGVSPTLVEDGEQMYRINLLGTAYLIKALAPHMKNGGMRTRHGTMRGAITQMLAQNNMISTMINTIFFAVIGTTNG